MKSCLVSLCIVLGLIVKGLDAQLYEWSCSPLDVASNNYLLPDLGIRDDEDAADTADRNPDNLLPSTANMVHIYPLPSTLNCSGTVSAVEYCYFLGREDAGSDRLIFTLLILEQSGLNFTVADRIDARSTPRDQICTNSTFQAVNSAGLLYCCDTLELDPMSHFPLPEINFSFGILPTPNLFRFNPFFFPLLLVEHFKFSTDTISIGTTYILNETDRQTDQALPLFKFLIIPDLEAVTTTNMPSNGGSTSTAVGVAVGVVFVLVLLLVVIVLVIAVVRHKRSQKSEQANIPELGRTYNNSIYGAGEQQKSLKYDYAVKGPNIYSDIVDKENPMEYEVPTDPEYSYPQTERFSNTYELVDPEPPAVQTYEPVPAPEPPADMANWNIESIYVVPGTDENTLYSQLQVILTGDLSRESVKLGGLLGSGQFGKVFKGVWHSSTGGDVEVAVKTLKEGSGEEDRVKFLQEAAIMGQFKHPNVVTMYGVVTDGEPILLVLELLKKGDLRDHLLHMRSEGGGVNVDDHTLLSYCHQVASGMAYLSSKAFVHRDLAARNILVSEGDICKIADFGMSRDLMDESYYVSHGGKIPVKWTAPEALHYKKYSSASDVWSYGALMYEIWSVGYKPYQTYSNNQVLKLVDTGFRLPPPPGCPRAVYSIMISCWHPMTHKRPSFADISNELSLPDGELLKWSKEDKTTHAGADKLGADLLSAQNLYTDLQFIYRKPDLQ